MKATYTPAQFNRATELTKVLGDSYSLRILYELTFFGEKSFNDLKRMADINAVTLTRKLTHLKELGYVTSEPVRFEIHYSITEKAEPLRPVLDEVQKLVLQTP